MDALERSYGANLVQIGECKVSGLYLGNCCGCCCEALQAARRFRADAVATTIISPSVNMETCIGWKCAKSMSVLASGWRKEGKTEQEESCGR